MQALLALVHSSVDDGLAVARSKRLYALLQHYIGHHGPVYSHTELEGVVERLLEAEAAAASGQVSATATGDLDRPYRNQECAPSGYDGDHGSDDVHSTAFGITDAEEERLETAEEGSGSSTSTAAAGLTSSVASCGTTAGLQGRFHGDTTSTDGAVLLYVAGVIAQIARSVSRGEVVDAPDRYGRLLCGRSSPLIVV